MIKEEPEETQQENALDHVIKHLFDQGRSNNGSAYLSAQKPDREERYAWTELQLGSMFTSIKELTKSEITILHRLLAAEDRVSTEFVKKAVSEVTIENSELGNQLVALTQEMKIPLIYSFYDQNSNKNKTSIGTTGIEGLLESLQYKRNARDFERSWEDFVKNYVQFYESAKKLVDILETSSSVLLRNIGDYVKSCLEHKRLKTAYSLAKEKGDNRVLDMSTVTLENRFVEKKKVRVQHLRDRNASFEVEIPGYVVVANAKDTAGNPISEEIGFIDGRNTEQIRKLKYYFNDGGFRDQTTIPCQTSIREIPSVIKPDYEAIGALLLQGAENPDVHSAVKLPATRETETEFNQFRTEMLKLFHAFGLLQHAASSVKYRQQLEKNNLPFCMVEETQTSSHPIQMRNGYAPVIVRGKVEKGENAVGNDFLFDNDQRIALSAGANGAGKTTYLVTVGQNYFLACAGWPNSAESVQYNSNGKIYTLFADRPKSIEGGKSRHIGHAHDVRYILEHSREGDLLLVDEFFTGTEESAASELGGKVIDYLRDEIQADACIATHIHKLQRDYVDDSAVRNLRAVLLSGNDGKPTPTYIIEEGIAGTSYGVETVRAILDMASITEQRTLQNTQRVRSA